MFELMTDYMHLQILPLQRELDPPIHTYPPNLTIWFVSRNKSSKLKVLPYSAITEVNYEQISDDFDGGDDEYDFMYYDW